MQIKAEQAVSLVQEVRHGLPRLGTPKLYHLLHEPLRTLQVGRDCLFAIMKANHLDIKPKRQYRITTNSHHRFRKHKNLIEGLDINKPEQMHSQSRIKMRTYKKTISLKVNLQTYG